MAVIAGTPGNDAGASELVGTAFPDDIDGLAGDDVLRGREGDDTLDGGEGFDDAEYGSDPAGIVADLVAGTVRDGHGDTDTLIDIEDIVGSAFGDSIRGNDEDNTFDAHCLT